MRLVQKNTITSYVFGSKTRAHPCTSRLRHTRALLVFRLSEIDAQLMAMGSVLLSENGEGDAVQGEPQVDELEKHATL